MEFILYLILIAALVWDIFAICIVVSDCLAYRREQIDKDFRRREAYNAVMSAKWRRELEEKTAKMKIIRKSTMWKSTQDPQRP